MFQNFYACMHTLSTLYLFAILADLVIIKHTQKQSYIIFILDHIIYDDGGWRLYGFVNKH